MLEPIIQLLIPLILGSPQILLLLSKRPRIPYFGPRSILVDVIGLCEEEEGEVAYDNAQQDLVPALVIRGVACEEFKG